MSEGTIENTVEHAVFNIFESEYLSVILTVLVILGAVIYGMFNKEKFFPLTMGNNHAIVTQQIKAENSDYSPCESVTEHVENREVDSQPVTEYYTPEPYLQDSNMADV